MESFFAGNTYNLDTEDNLPTLQIELFHKGQHSVSDALMGVINISLDTIDSLGQVTDLWYPLETAGRLKTVSGDVRYLFHILCVV